MVRLEELIKPESLDALSPEYGVAHGLPRVAYTSREFLELEYERVFKPSWTFVGFGHDIPHPGDVFPASAAGLPILLIRNREGEVNAFHNVCRHRGVQLVAEPNSMKRVIVCRYHGWTYDLDGNLVNTPHFGGFREPSVPGFDPCNYGLKAVRCAEWRHWLFVNLDGQAPPLDEHIEPIERHLKDYDLDSLRHVDRIFSNTINANWKFIIENYMEPYHVPYVHAGTTAGQPLEDHVCITDGKCVGSYVKVDEPKKPSGKGQRTVTEGPETLDTSAYYLDLFPNFGLSTFRDAAITVLMVPEAPDRTRWQLDLYFYGHVADDPEVVQRWGRLMSDVFAEDWEMMEAMQVGRTSPVMDDGGLLSPIWETCVQHFHKLVVDALR